MFQIAESVEMGKDSFLCKQLQFLENILKKYNASVL